jgi:hypothetical protein
MFESFKLQITCRNSSQSRSKVLPDVRVRGGIRGVRTRCQLSATGSSRTPIEQDKQPPRPPPSVSAIVYSLFVVVESKIRKCCSSVCSYFFPYSNFPSLLRKKSRLAENLYIIKKFVCFCESGSVMDTVGELYNDLLTIMYTRDL